MRIVSRKAIREAREAARTPGRAPALTATELRERDIALVRAPNSGPYTLSGTNSWILARDPAYLIDPGPADAGHVDALCAELEARGGAAAILLAHDHADHSAAAALVAARTGAPLAAMRAGADIELVDGARVGPLEVLATPGHSADHAKYDQ